MNSERLIYFKNKLNIEKRNLIKLMNSVDLNESSEELSFYDNHPSDIAEELSDKEKGIAIKQHEEVIVNRIDKALKKIDQGSFGVCSSCGEAISEQRLEFIPYAEYCIGCQNSIVDEKDFNVKDSDTKEGVLGKPFGYGYNDHDKDYKLGFDAEDSYQEVENFNRIPKIAEFDTEEDSYVDPMERVSNAQYKNQLPD